MGRLRACRLGSIILKIFLLLTSVFVVLYVIDLLKPPFGFTGWAQDRLAFILKTVLIVLLCSVVFWIGIIIVYITSGQLRLKKRVLGIIFGMVPIANLVMLIDIIVTVDLEYRFERKKILLDNERHSREVCRTKYPILMVHGVFFRDFKHIGYWGRIPRELERNGATIYYGEHNSASSVKESAEQLRRRIETVMSETGCEKVNVIAHSKGGLDMRMLLSDPEAAAHVASLTTINTPHRGCKFADYLFKKVPKSGQERLAQTYNAAAELLGDVEPDFIAAVSDLTASRCREMFDELPPPEGVYCRSVGSVQKRASSGRFPLNLTHSFVGYFDGENDGLVGVDSFEWGESLTMLRPTGRRGISHGDMVDLNRENIRGFDVREFYVELVSSLKERGL